MLNWVTIVTGSLSVEQKISLHVSCNIHFHQRAKAHNIDDSGHFRVLSDCFRFIHCYASFVLFTLMVWTVLFFWLGRGYNQKTPSPCVPLRRLYGLNKHSINNTQYCRTHVLPLLLYFTFAYHLLYEQLSTLCHVQL
jgi:hypothetical protein